MDVREFQPQAGGFLPPVGIMGLPVAPGTISRVPFRYRLQVVVQDAVLIGVKWMIVAVLALWAVGWALGDYHTTRQRAANGQAAADFIQRQLASQQTAPARPAVPNP